MGTKVYELKDYLNHQQYEWPLSLVRYPLRLQPGEAHPDSLILLNGEGRRVPVQILGAELSEGFVLGGEIAFLTDLPRGGARRYELQYSESPAAAGNRELQKGEGASGGLYVQEEGGSLRYGNGLIEVAVPCAGLVPVEAAREQAAAGSGCDVAESEVRQEGEPGMMPPEQEVFGLYLASGEKLAAARLIGGHNQCAMHSECVSSGPVLHEQRITFLWENNVRYAITIRLTAGMPFAELEEHMEGASGITLEIHWTGLQPTRRYTKSRGQEAIDAYLGEGGKLPFRILPYDNFHSWHTGRSASFEDEEKQLEVGLFHGDPLLWNDGEYALWRSSDTLAISFRYRDGYRWAKEESGLVWSYPLASGVRATKLAIYDSDKKRAAQSTAALRGPASGKGLPLIDELALWHSFLALDKVKDWVLDWEEPQEQYPRLFDPEMLPEEGHLWYFDLHELPRPEDMEEIVDKLSFNFNEVEGTSPVSSREFAFWTPIFDLSARDMTPEQFRRFKAASAMMAYVREDEYVAPIHTMLSGHPNFLADYKAVPGYMSALFPHHPHARRWMDHYEKAMALNLKYHTRPDVGRWNAEGGRWTENLGCYVWAALVPMLRAAWCLRRTHGESTLLYPNLAKLAGWLLGSLSAPLPGGRSYPPQGAHSGVHNDPLFPPYALRVLGEMMMDYEPLLAEQLLAVCPADASGFESKTHCDVWRLMLHGRSASNAGTPPALKSTKFTGYGYVLRSAVGSSGEMSVHLGQIDEGPNYRWGRSGNGGNGVIYYYADGKRYSYNRPEDVGDDNMGTGEGSTTFAVLDGHEYKSIGLNDLAGPLHDFGYAQFAELGAGPDAGPHYRSRSVLMSGNDYIVIYDEVADMRVRGRFSWFSHRDDPFPAIYQLKPGVSPSAAALAGPIDGPQVPAGEYRIKRQAHGYPDGSVGRYYDGFGDFLTIVTHRGEWQPQVLRVEATPYGAVVEMASREDYIFRSATRIRHNGDDLAFDGYAGIVRRYGRDHGEAALFRGRLIGVAGITATILPDGTGGADTEVAARAGQNITKKALDQDVTDAAGNTEQSASGSSDCSSGAQGEAAFAFQTVGGLLNGSSSSETSFTVRLEFPASRAMGQHKLFVNGKAQEAKMPVGGRARADVTVLEFTLPAGRSEWQWTGGDAMPGKPEKLAVSLASPSAADLQWDAAEGADRYELSVSTDGCRSWKPAAADVRGQRYRLVELIAGTKLHVRIRAWRGQAVSGWSEPYPIYPSEHPPAAPQGLRLRRRDGAVEASWGMVLGAQQYRLYRRNAGEGESVLLYEGPNRSFLDNGVSREESGGPNFIYSVAAVNGNGEGSCAGERETAPGGLIDWDPRPDEAFRRYARSHEYGHNGFHYWINELKGSLPPYPQD